MSRKFIVKGYQLGQKIDHSGLRTIYKGIQLRTNQEVFISFIAIRSERAITRLSKRAEQSRLLTHPSLISAIDYGVIDGEGFYFTHKAYQTDTLAHVLQALEDPEEKYYFLLKSTLRLMDTIAYIHDANVTHRELNTSQVFVDAHQDVYLAGFINAKARSETRNIANIVHLPYAAPEQLNGAPCDRRTDIYSLGMVFFELLTGCLPYDSNYAKLEDARQGIIPSAKSFKADVPESLDAIVRKALAPRSSRYRAVQEMVQDLESLYEQRTLGRKIKDLSQSIKKIFSFSV